MKNTKKLALAGVLIALAVVGSTFYIPVGAAKCCPVQHLVNVLSAVILGPWYGVIIAFIVSIIRNMLGIGSLLAFPGSMFGALVSGILYKYIKKLPYACVGELLGTSIIGGIISYPVALLIMGNKNAALFGFVLPFFISSFGGVIIAAIIIAAVNKTGILKKIME